MLTNVLGFWVHSLKLPLSVCHELERLAERFLWKGSMHARSWNSICEPKFEGGVDIRRVSELNTAGAVKLAWRFCSSQKLWAMWIRPQYLKGAPVNAATCSILDLGT